jgi:hypothetical protein
MTSKQPGQPSKFWLAFTVSSFEMPISFAFGLYGLACLIFSDILTPPSVDVSFQFWLIVVWHVLMFLGGLGTFVGRLFEWEHIELAGLAALGGSCVYYFVAAIAVNGSAAFGLSVLLGSVLWACATRMYVLRKSLRARELARNIAEQMRRNGHNGGHP